MFDAIFAVLCLCFLIELTLSAQAAEKVYKARIAYEDNETTPGYRAFALFKKLAEERSNGRLQFTIYPNELLGTNRETAEAAQIGAIEMLRCPGAILTAFIPEMGLLDIPFMFNSYDEARTVVEAPDLKQFMADACVKKGLVFLGYYEQGFRNITNNKKPIWKLEDLKGMKIRVPEMPLAVVNFRALGASPTPIPWGELFTALQQGIVDGQENPFYTIIDGRVHEVQSYLSVTNHMYDAFPNLASKKWWDRLPADLQKIIRESMDKSIEFEYSINKGENDAALMELLAMPTMKVNAVPAAELECFKKIGQEAVKKELYERLDDEIVDWWLKRVNEIVHKIREEKP
jgi:tripartite ATP-independent transporter DctP family solute receptor